MRINDRAGFGNTVVLGCLPFIVVTFACAKAAENIKKASMVSNAFIAGIFTKL